MFGLVQSPPDSRDWNYTQVMGAGVLPPRFSYADTPLRDQGQHGTCVGFGSANLKDSQEAHDSLMSASALYIYRQAKLIDGLVEGTEGTTLKAALSVLKNKGVCPESVYPYSLIDSEAPLPPDDTAVNGKINGYARCYTVDDIKQAIVNSGPVLIGVAVTSAFRDLGPGTHIIKSMFGSQILGGHCMLLTGYDDNLQAFRLKNSWDNWGEPGGYAWLGYGCVTERTDLGMSMFMEAWSSIDVVTSDKIEMWIGNQVAYVNGSVCLLDAPPTIMNNRTMVPLRFVTEAMGCLVEWDNVDKKVTVIKP